MTSKRNTNKYVLHNDYAEIIITSSMYGIFNIKVDLKDVEIQNKWMAFIMKDYHHHTLGYFDDINQAIECRRKAEIKYFGEYKNQDII